MYKAVFQSSKIALLFAGMTVLSAVSMVGTSEKDGVVGKAVDMFGAQASTDGQSISDKSDNDGSAEVGEVFGDYVPDDAATATSPSAQPGQAFSPINVPPLPSAIAVGSGSDSPSVAAFISDREMTVEAE